MVTGKNLTPWSHRHHLAVQFDQCTNGCEAVSPMGEVCLCTIAVVPAYVMTGIKHSRNSTTEPYSFRSRRWHTSRSYIAVNCAANQYVTFRPYGVKPISLALTPGFGFTPGMQFSYWLKDRIFLFIYYVSDKFVVVSIIYVVSTT